MSLVSVSDRTPQDVAGDRPDMTISVNRDFIQNDTNQHIFIEHVELEYEPRCAKPCFLHMRKQRRRSASQ